MNAAEAPVDARLASAVLAVYGSADRVPVAPGVPDAEAESARARFCAASTVL